MRPGYFFEPIEGTQTEVSEVIFRYLEVEHAGGYPIYLSIENEKIFFGITIPGEYEHSELLELYFSDYDYNSGKLSRQLLGIADLTQHHKIFIDPLPDILPQSQRLGKENVLVRSYTSTFSFENDNAGDKNVHKEFFHNPFARIIETVIGETDFKNQAEANLEKTERGVCLRTLFLDFLFDLKHSDVFANSKHYDLLLNISRSNFVFDSVIKICEYHYWRKDQFTQPAKGFRESLRAWHLQQKYTSIKNLIDVLTTKEASVLLGKSKWIHANLEASLYRVVDDLSDTCDSPGVEKSDSIWHQVSEWATRRYSYGQFVQAISPLNWMHFLILLFPFVLIFLVLHYGEESLTSDMKSSTRYFEVLKSGTLIVISFILLFCIDVRKLGKSKKPFLRAMLILVSPKIVLSSIFAWGTLELLKQKGAYFSQSLGTWSFIFITLGALLIPLLYLYRELLEEAPDLTSGKILGRTISAEIVVLAIVFLIGVPTMVLASLLSHSHSSAPDIQPILIKEVIFATPFVFFTLIFTKTLFAGKRFTGM